MFKKWWQWTMHYSRFGFFCPKFVCMWKEFELSSLPQKSYLASIFQVLKKLYQNVKIERKKSWYYLLKVSFPGHFLLCTVLLDAPELFSWGPGPNPTWSLRISIGCKNLDFLKIFFTNRILPNQAKS